MKFRPADADARHEADLGVEVVLDVGVFAVDPVQADVGGFIGLAL